MCEDCIYIYGFPYNVRMERLNKLKIQTDKNSKGILAISEDPETNIIAYSNNKNEIIINHYGNFYII